MDMLEQFSSREKFDVVCGYPGLGAVVDDVLYLAAQLRLTVPSAVMFRPVAFGEVGSAFFGGARR